MLESPPLPQARSHDYFAEIQICASMFQAEPADADDCPRLSDLIERLASRASAEVSADAR